MLYKSACNNNIAILHPFVKEEGGYSDYPEYNFLKVNLRQDTRPKGHHGSVELPSLSILQPQERVLQRLKHRARHSLTVVLCLELPLMCE